MTVDFKALRISLASPEEILQGSHGEVTKPETINYRTLRSEPNGLFCEKIFGPSKSYECFCGKYKKIRYKGIVCDRCGVEVTESRVRRERMGHIMLASPVTHIWFAHGVPNRLALILEIPQKKLETVIYYARYIVIDINEEKRTEALEGIKTVKQDELNLLEKDLTERSAQLDEEEKEKIKVIKKENKDEDKAGLQIERLNTKTRKEKALLKSAHSQKVKALIDKMDELETLIKEMSEGTTISEEQNSDLELYGFDFYEADMGAPAIRTLLEKLDLQEVVDGLDLFIKTTRSEAKKAKALQRKRVLKGMLNAGIRPEWIVLDILPVLPPDLRPIIQLPGGRTAASELNDLYRRIINRNNRLKRLIELGAPEVILRNERRMLQESVDALFDNSHRPGGTTNNSRGLPLKSLSDILRGKQGRFRANLLGKRVDYSGRAVIVPGPHLRFDQCGLPKTIALELFKPFVVRELIARGIATNPARANSLYLEKVPEVWDILADVSKDRPVLLNRAPTLHKQSIQAFFPVLIEGNSIQLHPMVCRGYNADFDGDQMAVHLPLSENAVIEAKERMMAKHNMLSMADGSPMTNTEKDMAIGVYFLTLMRGEESEAKYAFSSYTEALSRYHLEEISLYEPIKLINKHGQLVITTIGRAIFNSVLPEDYKYINETIGKKAVQKISADVFERYGRDVSIKFLDDVKDLGFHYATVSGFSISMSEFDFGAEELVKEKIDAYFAVEAQRLEDFYAGFSTKEELSRHRRDEWVDTTDEIGELTWNLAKKFTDSNLIHLDNSGATPVASWVKNISGVKGYVTDTQGNTVDLPLKGNYRKGLDNFEYFVAARSTRKSFADVALRTADSGYLTRRLVDVAQDIVTEIDDCHTEEFIYLQRDTDRQQTFGERVKGRFLGEDLVVPATGEILYKKGVFVVSDMADKIDEEESIVQVGVRSAMTCKAEHGVCRTCYGINFGTGQEVGIGEAVGIIAAQALGEPTTQLTLKNKSDARARGDVTQGLPRVEELFEVRTPKVKASIADMSGNVQVIQNEQDVTLRLSTVRKLKKTFKLEETDESAVKRTQKVKKGQTLIIKSNGEEIKAQYPGRIETQPGEIILLVDQTLESEYSVENMNRVLVKDGEFVEVGTKLTSGSIDPKELARLVSIESAQYYIIDQIQEVYGTYGIPVDDLHLELLVKRMAGYAQVTESDDSDTRLPGDYVDLITLEEENKVLEAEGKNIMKYQRVLLGVTNAALRTDSFLSAASFQQQVRVLTDASLMGKVDNLRGLKENVIIGRAIPVGKVLEQKLKGEEQKVSFDLGSDNIFGEDNN